MQLLKLLRPHQWIKNGFVFFGVLNLAALHTWLERKQSVLFRLVEVGGELVPVERVQGILVLELRGQQAEELVLPEFPTRSGVAPLPGKDVVEWCRRRRCHRWNCVRHQRSP